MLKDLHSKATTKLDQLTLCFRSIDQGAVPVKLKSLLMVIETADTIIKDMEMLKQKARKLHDQYTIASKKPK